MRAPLLWSNVHRVRCGQMCTVYAVVKCAPCDYRRKDAALAPPSRIALRVFDGDLIIIITTTTTAAAAAAIIIVVTRIAFRLVNADRLVKPFS